MATGSELRFKDQVLYAERMIVNGTDIAGSEASFLDGVVAGTAAVGKAVVLTTGKTIDALNITAPEFGGVAVTATAAEVNYNDIASLGTGAASKAVVLSATGTYTGPTAATTKWTWNVTSTSTDGGTSVEPFVHNTTMTGVGGVGGRARFELDTNVALGGWANALKAQLQLGAAGKVTGLGSAFVAELIMEAGAADGTYAPLELELGMPSGALTGTNTSFINMTAYGAAAGTFDTNGFLFTLSGVTKNTGKLLADTTSGATARPVQVLRVQTPDGTRYLPLYDTVAIAA